MKKTEIKSSNFYTIFQAELKNWFKFFQNAIDKINL